jgi:hypothetical protein
VQETVREVEVRISLRSRYARRFRLADLAVGTAGVERWIYGNAQRVFAKRRIRLGAVFISLTQEKLRDLPRALVMCLISDAVDSDDCDQRKLRFSIEIATWPACRGPLHARLRSRDG